MSGNFKSPTLRACFLPTHYDSIVASLQRSSYQKAKPKSLWELKCALPLKLANHDLSFYHTAIRDDLHLVNLRCFATSMRSTPPQKLYIQIYNKKKRKRWLIAEYFVTFASSIIKLFRKQTLSTLLQMKNRGCDNSLSA